MAETTSEMGRIYKNGYRVDNDLKNLVISELVCDFGGNIDTTFVKRGGFYAVSKKLKLHATTVKKIWNAHCLGNTIHSKCGAKRKLSDHDINYIEYSKMQKPSRTSNAIHADLMTVSTTDVCPRTVRRAYKLYMDVPYTFKRIKFSARERYTATNLQYTETFMALLNAIDPHRLRFMDESGFRLPEVSMTHYGHAPRGERAIEIIRYHSRPNATLHLLAGLHGVGHCKVTDGASDTYTFVNFITECVNTITEYGVSALMPGNVLVVDNAAIHHSEISQVLKMWLERQGIDVVFTPKYSPDMNPVEECFSKIKGIIRQPQYGQLLQENMHAAIYSTTKHISSGDMYSFFRHTGYISC